MKKIKHSKKYMMESSWIIYLRVKVHTNGQMVGSMREGGGGAKWMELGSSNGAVTILLFNIDGKMYVGQYEND